MNLITVSISIVLTVRRSTNWAIRELNNQVKEEIYCPDFYNVADYSRTCCGEGFLFLSNWPNLVTFIFRYALHQIESSGGFTPLIKVWLFKYTNYSESSPRDFCSWQWVQTVDVMIRQIWFGLMVTSQCYALLNF